MQVLNKRELARLLPHRGAMCLLESVESWDAESILCRATSHRDLDNPLRANSHLPSICGVEYAAQAMAVHGALAAPENPRAGMLAALREVKVFVSTLDVVREDLSIRARKLLSEGHRMLYEFSVETETAKLVTGRAGVVLDTTPGRERR